MTPQRFACLAVALLSLASCRHLGDMLDPERKTAREQAERDRHDAEDAAARRRAEQEAEMNRLCLHAETDYQVNFCAAREREKDRAAQREQWERENQLREEQLDLQREQLAADRKERRRRAFETCTSTKIGDTVRTNCF